MAENDIYNSQARYERLTKKIKGWTYPAIRGARRYWIQCPDNRKYFDVVIAKSESKDLSYIRRVRLLHSLLVICYIINKDLATADRKDVDELLAFAHTVKKTYESKKSFFEDVRHLWKLLCPEKDSLGREDETLIPYPVRHIKVEPDKSRKKMRKDKLRPEEVTHILNLFFDRPDIQSAIVLAYEGLARPQEILGRKISDVKMYDGYAKVWITEHGKEGTGFIPVIEHVSYLKKWLENHPLQNNPDAPLFFSQGSNTMFRQMTPIGLNKAIRKRLEAAGITKRLTLYSFKRNGVTHMRLNGYSDNAIQHRARWTSTDQLQTYDLGNQDDAFRMELEQKGLIQGKRTADAFFVEPQKKCQTIQRESKRTNVPQKYCTNCGGGLVPCAKFCGDCGSPSTAPHIPQSNQDGLYPELVTRGHGNQGTESGF